MQEGLACSRWCLVAAPSMSARRCFGNPLHDDDVILDMWAWHALRPLHGRQTTAKADKVFQRFQSILIGGQLYLA